MSTLVVNDVSSPWPVADPARRLLASRQGSDLRHGLQRQDQPAQGSSGCTHHGGQITLGEQDLGKVQRHQIARAGLGYVPQGRMIFPRLTVEENLKTGFACLPGSERGIPDRIFRMFPVLADFMGRRGGDLSGGQQQQLAIARALITRPKVLILESLGGSAQCHSVDR